MQRKINKLRNLIGGSVWFPKPNTNLPAGLLSMVSSLNEYMGFINVTRWLWKGGIIGSISPPPPMVSTVKD